MTKTTTKPPSIPLEYASGERGLHWSDALTKLGPLIGMVFVYVLFTVLISVFAPASRFATVGNAELMLRQTAVVGIAAIGMTLIIISGGIDLSVGSNIALTTVVIALLLRTYQCSLAVASLGGIAAGGVCGLVTGLLVTQLRLSPFIATLGMWGAVRGFAKVLAGSTRIDLSDRISDTWFGNLLYSLTDSQKWKLFPGGVWLMFLLAAMIALMLRYTRLGRHIFAIGSNEQTARLCGVSVNRTKILIYLLGAVFAGVAGVLETSYVRAGDPTTRDGAELDIIAAVVIGGASLSGGQGSVVGSLIGALIMTIVANGCVKLGWGTPVRQIATGGIIVLAVALDQLRQRRT